MKTRTTPGIDFLIRNLVVPAGLNYGLIRLALHYSKVPVAVPGWALTSVSILLVPARAIAGAIYTYYKDHRDAAALGARLPPVIDSKSFGNRKLLAEMRDAWMNGYPGDAFWDIVKDLGRVFNLRIMFLNQLYTVEPEHIKRLLATEFDNFEKGEPFRNALAAVLGSGVFNSDGDMWKFHRTMARPFFSRDRVTDLEKFDKHIQTGISLFKQRMKTGYAIDFQDLAHRIVMDMASEFLLGKAVNTLDLPVEDLPQPYNHPDYAQSLENFPKYPANAFSEAFSNALFTVASRDRMSWLWPLAEIFGDKTKPYMKVVDEFIMPIIKEAIKKNTEGTTMDQSSKTDVRDDDSLLDYLTRQTTDIDVLKDQTLNILLAGRDTIAATLTFMFYLLSKHPDVQTRLRREVLETVGPNKLPTYDELKQMKYLRAVINETLRILPPVPWDVRQCIRGTLWPSSDPNEKPFYLPPGTTVAYGIIMIQTFEELWGPDAAEFDPDRFLDDRKKYMLANPFIFMPFNAGPRICLGQQLAYNELSLLTVRLLQQFTSFTMDPDALAPEHRVPEAWAEGHGRAAKEAFRPKVILTMSCQGGMWLKADPVQQE